MAADPHGQPKDSGGGTAASGTAASSQPNAAMQREIELNRVLVDVVALVASHEAALVELYRSMLHAGAVAKVCDEIIDPSGALLGRIRKQAL